ncbi:MAG TPA: hypothetical protein VGB42_11140 [Candidatus Thermoplasmatota archaeon]
MEGEGPYLWLGEYAPPAGFRHVPPGAMCLGVFLFVRQGSHLLLGKVRDHPAWPGLAGDDPPRVREDQGRWKVPARQLRLGEDPRDAARQIGEEVLGLTGLSYEEPRVEVEFWKLGDEASGPPERRDLFHFDVWFFVDASLPEGRGVAAPPWYAELAWLEPERIPPDGWARLHGDVVTRWRQPRAPP